MAKKKTGEDDTALVIRTCDKDLKAYGGFQWPSEGEVVAPDWDPKPECGKGLHGLFEGHGDWSLLSSEISAKWLLVEVKRSECIEIGNKVKFPRGRVVYSGDMATAMTRIAQRQIETLLKDPKVKKKSSGYGSTAASSGNYSTAASSGNYSTAASSGNYSTAASSGNYSTAASSGNYSTAASSGNYSTAASSGNYSKAASSGYGSTAASSGDGSKAASSGNYSTAASSGNYSTAASSGNYSTAASSGNYSTAASSGDGSKAASSGYGSTAASSGDGSKAASSGDGSKAASSGDGSTAEAKGKDTIAMVAGTSSSASAGENGCVALCWHDGKRNRILVGYVGEDGIKADTLYWVVDGKLAEVKC